MESKWDFYFTRVNDTVSSVYVDLALRQRAPLPEKPWRIHVFVDLNAPREDGLSSAEEAPTLVAIEDALLPTLTQCVDGLLVGRVTSGGTREFHFYGSHAKGVEAAVEDAMRQFPDYRFEVGEDEDPEWGQYLDVLYPSPRDKQRMNNRRVLEQLAEHGDRHELQRDVDHLMYFKSEACRIACRQRLINDGFRIGNEEIASADDGEARYSLEFHRVDPVEWKRINEITIKLAALAEEYEGEYDGWGCEVTDGN